MIRRKALVLVPIFALVAAAGAAAGAQQLATGWHSTAYQTPPLGSSMGFGLDPTRTVFPQGWTLSSGVYSSQFFPAGSSLYSYPTASAFFPQGLSLNVGYGAIPYGGGYAGSAGGYYGTPSYGGYGTGLGYGVRGSTLGHMGTYGSSLGWGYFGGSTLGWGAMGGSTLGWSWY